MADNRVVAEIVSQFFLITCQLRRPVNVDAIAVVFHSSRIVDDYALYNNELDAIPLSTGSVAEFYIEPMLSCIRDADVMLHRSDELAIPQGHLPPTQLPAEFHGRVNVYEIIDSEFPGYVYLVKSYLLTEITDDGKYNAVRCQPAYTRRTRDLELSGGHIHGPAVVTKLPNQPQIGTYIFFWIIVVIRCGTLCTLSVVAVTSR